MHALIHGEKYGLTKNSSLCEKNVTFSWDSFLNAVYCVGNYDEIFSRNFPSFNRSSINRINDGSGMLYAIPFGDMLADPNNPPEIIDRPDRSSTLEKIERVQTLKCGVVELEVVDGNLTGMGVDYCYSLAAAIFNGKYDAVNFTHFEANESAFSALGNETIDVLVGGEVDLIHDEECTFSTPYYRGNESGQ